MAIVHTHYKYTRFECLEGECHILNTLSL